MAHSPISYENSFFFYFLSFIFLRINTVLICVRDDDFDDVKNPFERRPQFSPRIIFSLNFQRNSHGILHVARSPDKKVDPFASLSQETERKSILWSNVCS